MHNWYEGNRRKNYGLGFDWKDAFDEDLTGELVEGNKILFIRAWSVFKKN